MYLDHRNSDPDDYTPSRAAVGIAVVVTGITLMFAGYGLVSFVLWLVT